MYCSITLTRPSSSFVPVTTSAAALISGLSVAHRHAQPRILDHGQIVKTIAAGDYILAFQSKALDQARDRRALVHAGAA